MKTIAKILLALAILWTLAFVFKLGNSFAAGTNACANNMWSWSVSDANGWNPPYMLKFNFDNKTENVAKIYGVKIYTKSKKLVYDRKFHRRDTKKPGPKYIKPFEKTFTTFAFGADLPWDIMKAATIDCESITYDQYEDELIEIYNSKNSKSSINNLTSDQNELFQGCLEDSQNLGSKRSKEYCRCITIMITDKYSIEEITRIGQQSQKKILQKFRFATNYCNLNPKAPTDK